MLRDFSITQLKGKEHLDWLLKKHYAKRLPSISYAFGLQDLEKNIVGVITFGSPPNKEYNDGKCIFNSERVKTLELNRLVINSDMPKNTASYFIMGAVNKLPKPTALVSYADANQNHHGYVYQATNWMYTGTSAKKYKYFFEDGSTFDLRRGIHNKGKIIGKEKLLPTHRYVYIHADKRDRKKLLKDMSWDIKDYPKGLNKNYECVDIKMKSQLDLF